MDGASATSTAPGVSPLSRRGLGQRHVSILIATYRRPEGLLRLLRSIEELVVEPEQLSALEVVVVDNDPAASGLLALGESFVADYRWPVRVIVEPLPGISEARNRSLREAHRPDFVAFVDDDEYVSPQWLSEMLDVQHATGADAVLGPVLPELPAETPDWIRRGAFFERPRFENRAEVPYIRTSNLLVRCEALIKLDGPVFDRAFSLTGGGDTHLGMRLQRTGATFRWADRATVHETVPPNRATALWLLRRSFRLGASLALVERDIHSTFWPLVNRAVKGAGRVAIGVTLLLPSMALGRVGLLRSLRTISVGLGMIGGVLGFKYHEYKRP